MADDKNGLIALFVALFAMIIALASIVNTFSGSYEDLTDKPIITGSSFYDNYIILEDDLSVIDTAGWVNITGFNINVSSGDIILFALEGLSSGHASTNAFGLCVNSLVTYDMLSYYVNWQRSNTAQKIYTGTEYEYISTSTYVLFDTPLYCSMNGFIECTSNGTLFFEVFYSLSGTPNEGILHHGTILYWKNI